MRLRDLSRAAQRIQKEEKKKEQVEKHSSKRKTACFEKTKQAV